MQQTMARANAPSGAREPDFRTQDINLAAALLAAEWPLNRIERHNDRAHFVFLAPRSILSDTIEDYFSGRLMVPARLFADHVRGLKAAALNPKGGC